MDRFKEALDSLNKLTDRNGTLSYVEMGEWICEYCQDVRSALILATEAEQLRKERDEFAGAIIKIHEDQEGDYDFLKFISHPQYILAKKVRNENGNA